MARLSPPKTELWGATLGEKHVAGLRERLSACRQSDDRNLFIAFDFSGINGTSPSYLKRFFAPVFGVGGEEPTMPAVFPVFTNLAPDVREDLEVYLNERSLTVREVSLEVGGVTHCGFVGEPERVAKQTLEALEKFNEASAIDLHGECDGFGIAPTAWNNRLTNLYRLRLATKRREGRTLIYQSALQSQSWAKA